ARMDPADVYASPERKHQPDPSALTEAVALSSEYERGSTFVAVHWRRHIPFSPDEKQKPILGHQSVTYRFSVTSKAQ
ncbi:MAG TPA: hypothetical protein VKR06_40350, partial [Ktedonosporobacter sp.]|nr:hypothetical protein [Ktedonosporobacter sp.]